jgi:hypothetical protein
MTFRERILLICVLGLGAVAIVIAQLSPGVSEETNVASGPSRWVAGTVVDDNNNPVANAEVGLVGRVEMHSTGKDGKFRFAVSEGNRDAFLSLRVAKPGYATQVFNVAPPVETLTVQLARTR